MRTTPLDGVVVVEPTVHRDPRGFFLESYHHRDFAAAGISDQFVQDNHSRSVRGVLRGIHYQDLSAPMAKLVRCTAGRILDVAVDLRAGSPTFGRWYGIELSEENMNELLVPIGFGHAFLTLSDQADVQYKCSGYYSKAAEGAVRWNDPEIAIRWPVEMPTLSDRDSRAPTLAEYLRKPAFRYPPPRPSPARGEGDTPARGEGESSNPPRSKPPSLTLPRKGGGKSTARGEGDTPARGAKE